MGKKQTVMVNGAEMDVTGFPQAAIDALLKAEADRVAAVAKAATAQSRGIGYTVGPSGTLTMTGINWRGLSLYGGQWDKVIAEVTSGRLAEAQALYADNLATRDANGNDVAPKVPLPNYGVKGKAPAARETAAPQTLHEKAQLEAGRTMAARDAADAAREA